MADHTGKHISINADDLGLNPGVNQAIRTLAGQGILDSASFMAYGHIGNEDKATLNACALAIGLHFDLTSALPRPHGDLTARPLPYWIIRTALRSVSPAALKHTAQSQLRLFADTWGRPPAFIDGHEHVHQFAQIRTALIEAWQALFADAPLKLRLTRPAPQQGTLKAHIIYALGGRATERLSRRHGWALNDSFGGVYDFQADLARLAALWEHWLRTAPPHGCQIMCHPGINVNENEQANEGETASDPIAQARMCEFAWLSHPDFARLCRHLGIAKPNTEKTNQPA